MTNQKQDTTNETFRKSFHVLHGVGLAALALILPLKFLIGLEVIFLISVVISRYLVGNFTAIPWIKYFSKVYNVGRVSFGEYFFPISAIILVFMANSKWEFAASILVLGLADTAAALVGKRYGKSSQYKILGQNKSLVGSAAFLTVTIVIIYGFVSLSGADVGNTGWLAIVWVSVLLTITENIGVYGSDNLLIPVIAVLLLNRL